jgi:pimeloyl-ACP methyl ester carboxylesterase
LIDYFKLVAGSKYTIGKLWDEITAFDIKNMNKRFEIPVYFIYGKSDVATSSSIGKTFLNEIKAPRKGLYLIEKSGHFPQYENHIEYEKVIFEKILCEKNS